MDKWINLTGCSTCINNSICEKLGNCSLLNINILYPTFTKKKRKFIQRVRQTDDISILTIDHMTILKKPKEKNNKPVLTSFEKLCIESLNKNR